MYYLWILSTCCPKMFLNCRCYFCKEIAFFNNNETRLSTAVEGEICEWKVGRAGSFRLGVFGR